MPLAQPHRRRVRVTQVACMALVGVILSIAAFQLARQSDAARVKADLERRVEWRARDIGRKLAVAGRSDQALATFLTAEGDVRAARFHYLARLAHDQTDFDSALYWSPFVLDADRAAFVAAARSDGDPGYDICEIGPDKRPILAPQRAQYLPRLFEEIFDDTKGIPGIDLMVQPERLELIQQAVDSGLPVAAPPFASLLTGARVPGFLIFWPVYSAASVPPSVEARRAAFRGIATARFRFDRVLPALIAETPGAPEAVDIAVGSTAATAHLIGSFDPATKTLSLRDTPTIVADGSLTLQHDFTVLGQHWIWRWHFAPETVASLTSSAPWAWLFFGPLATAMLIVFIWRQTALLGQVQVIASETDDRFRRLFDGAPVSMSLATADEYRFVRVNAALCRMLEYTEAELIGHTRDEFAAPDSIGVPLPVESGVQSGFDPVDKHYVSKSGKVISARVRVVRLAPSKTGTPLVLGIAEDVTEQRKLETALRQTQKMEAIGQLTGGMAHDFNNLLGIIIGNLDLIEALPSAQGEAAELIEEAVHAALRGADLTSRLLAFARRQPLNPNHTDLNEVVREIAKLLSRTLGEQVLIELHLSPDVWPVLADATQLESCIISLATNARDAMPNGGTLTLATTNQQLDTDYAASHEDVQAGDYGMIEISDTGTGMPPDVLAHIFDPFFTTKEIGQGTGLGLSTVFGFLKQSNGHVSADSEPGVGSTFRVYLPRAADPATARQSPPASTPPRANGETILVVEDNETLRRVAARQLKDLGYAVIEARCAKDALTTLTRQGVHLVFTDVVMPGELDGFALARHILIHWPEAKVLLTSGFPETKIHRQLGALSGSVRLLGKPYRTDDLARMVREVLDA